MVQLCNEIDRMSQADALTHIDRVVEATVAFRNRYENLMIANQAGPQFEEYRQAWEVDCSNILKMLRLKHEIQAEE